MPASSTPIVRDFPHFLHGGDYNPEQWRLTPDVWNEDVRLLRQAACNTVTLGVFAWSSLEPAEGQFDFGWMDQIFGKCQANGIRVILATPGGGKPAWMPQKYP